ncbi:MAG: hypothetical protein H0T76_18995 [Nannocystis sp.]|nr:hypothetical protein [Nannocystis sp.]MBA3548576.1 hypothetical protein [Nannocystis sp.]
MLLDRHRIAKLIELADLERRLAGAERQQREEDVALLVKAAYDDASDAARAAFMARVQAMPATAWPWSAVQVKAGRSAVVAGPGGRVTMGPSSTPAAVAPPALLLIRGEAESADVEPGNRLPDQGTLEAATWGPLLQALDRWDTPTIARWIGPQGWVSPSGATTGLPTQGADGDVGIPPSADGTGNPPAPPSPPPSFSWRSPAVVAAGATVASTLGVVLFSLRRRRQPAPAPAQEAP